MQAASDRPSPNMNIRGNKTRRKAPTAFAESVLKAACGTTAMKNSMKPAIAACMRTRIATTVFLPRLETLYPF